MSSKKITYSSDFKLKVLDYYFKNGGDEIFGLKKKTAGHFNIDKKTINRMLNNPDMVKRARKLMSAKKATSNVKSSTSRQPVKTTVKNAKAGGNASKAAPASRMASSSQSSASSSTSNNNKATTSSTSSTKSISNSSRQVNHTASSGTSSINGGADRSTPSKSKPGGTEAKNSPGVQIFELPEDPDYSLLKKSISSSSNGVASLAKLLVTGTEEVRNVILNECDVILECKVCRNLFRSVVNFLAHKRIYCQEEFADVRTLFHKGDVQGVTSQSNTIVVEPEPPPDNENFNPVRTTVPSSHTSPLKPGSQSRPKHSAIDSIALKLARKRKAFHSSSSTHVGSSSYFQSLSEIGRNRDKLSRDCSVVLEDIGGVSNAVYQSYIPPGSTPKTSMSCIIDEASHSKSGITVAINQNGEIVKTAAGDVSSMDVEEESSSAEARDLTCLLCNTRFATQKTLSVHQRSHHGFERCVYSCPICKTSFSSMWAVVRHLQITHKKNKNQIERLRKVVRKNVRKKMVYPSPGKNDAHSDIEKEGNDTTEEAEEEDGDEEDSNDSSSKASEVAVPKRGEVSSALQMSAHKNDDASSRSSPDHRCIKCERKFNTSAALSSHDKFCSLMQMVPPDSSLNPCLRSETPEKKIAIQIRKDYKKPATPFDINKTSQLMFKVPKTPQEQENQTKIEEMMGEFCSLPSFSCVPCGKRYQTVSALKRHAASHIEWTRFECSVCHYRSYHRYEVINHCMTEHKAKGSAAANMVIEEERIGSLKLFLDSEEVTPATSDIEHEQQHPSLPSTTVVLDKVDEALVLNKVDEAVVLDKVDEAVVLDKVDEAVVLDKVDEAVVLDKVDEAATPVDGLEKNYKESETNKPSHSDLVEPMSVIGCDENKLLEDKATDICSNKASEDTKTFLVPGETQSLPNVEETSTFSKSKEIFQLPLSQMDETSDSESPVNCIHPSNSMKDNMGIMKSYHEDAAGKYSCKEEMKDSFEEDRLKNIHESENKYIACKEETNSSVLQHPRISSFENKVACLCIDKTDKCVCNNSDKNMTVDKIISPSMEETSKSSRKKESDDSVCEEDKKDKSLTKELENSVTTDTKSACMKTEKSSCNENYKSQLKEAEKDVIIQDKINESSDEEIKKLKYPSIKESDSSVNESGESKEEAFKIISTILSDEPDACGCEVINSDSDEKSNQNTDVPDNHPAVILQENAEDHNSNRAENKGELQLQENDDDSVVLIGKTDEVESSSVPAETVIELDSLTVCSEQTVASQSISAAEISSLEGDADSACVEDDDVSIKQEEDRWMDDDDDNEDDDDCPKSVNDSDTEFSDYDNPSLVDIYRFEDMRRSQNIGAAYLDKEVKSSIPKDDLSLELKDFVGFPSEKDERVERPNRVRRSVEREDFIYDLKKTHTHKDESEAEGSNVFRNDGEGIKQEGGRCGTRRRSLAVKSEIMPKRIKNEDEENSHESCNGSNVQSVSQETVAIAQSAESSGFQSSSSGFERKKVRLSRRRLDITSCEDFAFLKDGSVSQTGESETSCANPKLLIKKESLTVTRYSPRLKMAASPVPKKGSKPDFLSSSNARLLTNGQGQAVSVLSTAKVKLKGEP